MPARPATNARKGRTGRQRVDVVAALPRPTGRDAIWASIRKRRRKAWSARDLTLDQDLSKRTITGYLNALLAAGIIAEAGLNERQAKLYRLVQDKGAHAPRLRPDGSGVQQGRGTANMWRTMKLLGEFTPSELALHAATEAVPVTERSAKAYLKYLLKAGYVRLLRPAVPGRTGRQASYRFVRFTGPRAPQIQSIKQVWDPNLGEVVWRPGERGQ